MQHILYLWYMNMNSKKKLEKKFEEGQVVSLEGHLCIYICLFRLRFQKLLTTETGSGQLRVLQLKRLMEAAWWLCVLNSWSDHPIRSIMPYILNCYSALHGPDLIPWMLSATYLKGFMFGTWFDHCKLGTIMSQQFQGHIKMDRIFIRVLRW